MPKPPGHVTFQLHIELQGVTPAVWRRVLVPASVGLLQLSDVLLAAMGWNSSHMHCFQIGDRRYDRDVGEKTATAHQALRGTSSFSYEYDFGDSWTHEVVIEERLKSHFALKAAVCLAGENACPPDDCGGWPGYVHLLEALADPSHESHDELVEWTGGSFNPTAFDLVSTNAIPQTI